MSQERRREAMRMIELTDEEMYDWNGEFVLCLPRSVLDENEIQIVQANLWDFKFKKFLRKWQGYDLFLLERASLVCSNIGVVLDKITDSVEISRSCIVIRGHYNARKVYEPVNFPLRERCTKAAYDTHTMAIRRYVNLASKYKFTDMHQRPYKCDNCGKWHMTSMTPTEFRMSKKRE